ncbi:universal stress protein [Rapidithrix thailandica]|uniref:Universal stress protein n=1 Tax=Rapidithrix thailandica TaxID=413964 RepID=A0AAW9RZT2_9BACT
MNIQQIVVPVDFTPESYLGIDEAVILAKETGAVVKLLHVIDIPYVGERPAPFQMIADVGNVSAMGYNEDNPEVSYMHDLLGTVHERFDEIKKKYPEAKLEVEVKTDTMQRYLSEFVVKDGGDLVVVGTTGKSGARKSKAADIIRHAPIPVLTVTKERKENKYKNIVFASQFKYIDQSIVEHVKSLQQLHGARVHFVKIVSPSNFYTTPDVLSAIRHFAKENGFENYTSNLYNSIEVEEGVLNFARSVDADMIAMNTHGHTGFARTLFGSIAEEVAVHSEVPVLTLNERFD